MPFSSPNTLEINVPLSTIQNGGTSTTNNSLSLQLVIERDNKNLPGINDDQDVSFCAGNLPVEINAWYSPSHGAYLCNALLCSTSYIVDYQTSLIIAGEKLGIKPTQAYTATLTKA